MEMYIEMGVQLVLAGGDHAFILSAGQAITQLMRKVNGK